MYTPSFTVINTEWSKRGKRLCYERDSFRSGCKLRGEREAVEAGEKKREHKLWSPLLVEDILV